MARQISCSKEELEKDLIENYEKYPAKHFSDKYGLNLQNIYNLSSKLRVTRANKWGKHKDELIADYKSGLTLRQVAKKYGHDRTNIKKFLIENGIYVRNNAESKRIFEFDENYFVKIDAPKKAYWLGFIYGDGNVYQNRLQIGLQERDRYLLQELLDDLGSKHKIYEDSKGPKLVLRSHPLVNSLKDLGVVPKKSLILESPKRRFFDEKFDRYFLLGFFDADGYISKGQQLGFTGTKPMLEWVKKRLEVFGKDNLCVEKRGLHGLTFDYYLNVNNSNRQDVFNYFYDGHGFGLKRKKEKFYVR